MAGRLAAQYAGAATSLQKASLAYLAVILLVISLAHQPGRPTHCSSDAAQDGRGMSTQAIPTLWWRGQDRAPAQADRPDHGRRGHRRCAIAVAVLAIVLLPSVAKKGLPAINLNFFTQNAAPFGQSGGGIANAIVGTVIIVAIVDRRWRFRWALLAIFNTEFAPPPVADAIRLTLNVLAGVPTIVIGVFIFSLVVVGRGQSGFAGAIGLAIVMLPLVAKGTEEVLLLVPASLREGEPGFGASWTRTVLTVVLPTAVGGMVTATIVAVARAAGKMAPLLFTCSIFVSTVITTDPRQPMATLPIVIFTSSESPSAHDQQQAWAAALVLIELFWWGASWAECCLCGRAARSSKHGESPILPVWARRGMHLVDRGESLAKRAVGRSPTFHHMLSGSYPVSATDARTISLQCIHGGEAVPRWRIDAQVAGVMVGNVPRNAIGRSSRGIRVSA